MHYNTFLFLCQGIIPFTGLDYESKLFSLWREKEETGEEASISLNKPPEENIPTSDFTFRLIR